MNKEKVNFKLFGLDNNMDNPHNKTYRRIKDWIKYTNFSELI